MIIPFIVGVLISLDVVAQTPHVGIEAWCIVNKTNGQVECNYKTKEDCEAFRYADEECEPNPDPGKEY